MSKARGEEPFFLPFFFWSFCTNTNTNTNNGSGPPPTELALFLGHTKNTYAFVSRMVRCIFLLSKEGSAPFYRGQGAQSVTEVHA